MDDTNDTDGVNGHRTCAERNDVGVVANVVSEDTVQGDGVDILRASKKPTVSKERTIYDNGRDWDERQRDLGKLRLTIADVASVVRSKNSGPYEITLDILFDDPTLFAHVRDSNVLTSERLQGLYGLQDGDIVTNMFFEPASGWKATFKRPPTQLQGSVGERDTFGTQLHAPLL
ncbi:hypothetical protein SPI_04640 [Niveomyces insectorum RCEF 264]|uniref:DUF4387 domain-containing protein n=1 Tax=Niveomyces insectorum RCEF 264 TaxID=1081102 RepID=A0A167UPQ0_9HYPO|nr:hypothetical protein SPI_04640 [Niveomyces insectorum RCEF 264]